MRCEANISIRPLHTEKYGTKVEVKNLNSFRSVRNAIEYEVKRQKQVIEEGNTVRQVTMGWDEGSGITREQRSKETSEDYRYFPEPDLLNIHLNEDWIDHLKSDLPELPTTKADRFSSRYGLNHQDISVITEDRSISDYFEAILTFDNIDPKQATNWILGEVFRC